MNDTMTTVRWVGPDWVTTTLGRWDSRIGGSWRYVAARDGLALGFHGCFHEVRPDRIVQTLTWEGDPDGVALETLNVEDLGDGRTRRLAPSRCEKLDALLAAGEIAGTAEGAQA